MDNLVPSPILDEIKSYFSSFNQISFARVYRDQKPEYYTLSRRDSSYKLIHAYRRNLKIGLWYRYPPFLSLLEGKISRLGHLFSFSSIQVHVAAVDGAYVFRRLGWSLYRFVSMMIPSLKIYDAILDATIMYHKWLLCTVSCVRNNPLIFLRFSKYEWFNYSSTFLRGFLFFNFAMVVASTVCTSFHMNRIAIFLIEEKRN